MAMDMRASRTDGDKKTMRGLLRLEHAQVLREKSNERRKKRCE